MAPQPHRRLFSRAALCLSLGAGALSTPLAVTKPAQAAIVERVVAIVGQHAILLTDLRERAMPFLLHIYNTVPAGPQRAANISQVYKAVLDQMINEELESVAARDTGIDISEAQIDQAIAQTAAQNGISVNGVLAEAKRSGISIPNYREELRRQLIQRALIELRLRGRVRVTEQDVRATYRRLATDERMQQTQRTVQLRIPQGSTTQSRAKQRKLAQKISDEARAGADFRDLINRYAATSGSGLRPPLPPMQEPAAVQRATLALEVGETSQPVSLDGDWVIIQVIERPPSQLPPYNEARDQMQERVYMEKISLARKHWLTSLRKRTHVEVRL